MRLRQQPFVVGKLTLILCFQNLIRALIDLREKVALVDQLAFGEADGGELTVDLRLHGHRRQRRDGAERVDDDTDIAERDGAGADRLRRGLQVPAAAR